MPSLDSYRITKELNLEDFEYGSKIEQKYFFLVRFDSFLDGFTSYNNIYTSQFLVGHSNFVHHVMS